MIKDPALGIGRIEPFGFVHLALLTPVACFRVFLRIPRKTGAINCSAWTSRLVLIIVVIWRLFARARFAPVEISVTGAALLPTGLGSVPAARVAQLGLIGLLSTLGLIVEDAPAAPADNGGVRLRLLLLRLLLLLLMMVVDLLSVDLTGRVVSLIVVCNGQLEPLAHLGKIGWHISQLRRLKLVMLVRVLTSDLLEYGEHLLAPIAKLGERELALGVGGLLLSRWRVSHPLGAEVEA